MNKETNTEDKRVALPEGYVLTIIDKDTVNDITNTYKVTVQKKISSGGTCLVYQGSQNKSVGGQKVPPCDVIIKEFYPSSLRDQIKRINGTRIEITNEEARIIYENKLEGFKRGQANHIAFAYNNPENALPPPLCTGLSEETGAFYSVSQFVPGKVLVNMAIEEYSIVEALELSISICEAIGKVHKGEDIKDEQGEIIEKYSCSNGLYLDLKPDNVYVLNNRAYLFDFDTVQKRRSLKFSSYSKGYSAPEQEIVEGIGYKDESKIGYHTDIFSIGAVLCYLLTGKNPYEIGLETIKSGFDWKTGIRLKDSTKALEDDEFIHELDRLMRSMLEEDADKRMNSFICSNEQMSSGILPVEILKTELTRLINLAKHSTSKKEHAKINEKLDELLTEKTKQKVALKPKGVNRFQYCSDIVSFQGRKEELNMLLKMCKENEEPFCWTGICGEGGSGKTRLAYELCKLMSEAGWRVYWPSYARFSFESIKKEISDVDSNILICFDDADKDIESIIDISLFCLGISNDYKRIRIILIDREFSFSYNFLSKMNNYSYLTNSRNITELSRIDEHGIKCIFREYAEYYKKPITDEDTNKLYARFINIDKHERPLFALLICDLWISKRTVRKSEKKYILTSIMNREFEIAESIIHQEFNKKSERKMALDTIKLLMVLSYFVGSFPMDSVSDFVMDYGCLSLERSEMQYVVEQLGVFDAGMITNIYPDILSGFICVSYINSLSQNKAVSLVEYIIKTGGIYAIEKICLLCDFFNDILISPTNVSVIQSIDRYVNHDLINDPDLDIKDDATESDIASHILKSTTEKFFSTKDCVFHDIDVVLPDGNYTGKTVLGKPCGYGRMLYNNGDIYEGEWNAGEKSGHGKEVYQNGNSYEGEWLNGQRNGEGILIVKDSFRYEGSFRSNRPEGSGTVYLSDGTSVNSDSWKFGFVVEKGIYISISDDKLFWEKYEKNGDQAKIIYSDGSSYSGKIVENYIGQLEPKGYGILYTHNGNRIEGEFDGHKCNGTIYFVSGNRYEGLCNHGYPDGQGIYYCSNGYRYDGDFEFGKPNGNVKEYRKDGSLLFWGRESNGKWYGHGICYHPNGTTEYDGEWKDNMRDGQGTYYSEDGTIQYKGKWKNDQPNGRGIAYYGNGRVRYVGDRKEGKADGIGIQYYENGSVKYKGHWKDGDANGQGTYCYINGSVYKGNWKDDKRNGHGILYKPDGTIEYEGEWKDDKPVE